MATTSSSLPFSFHNRVLNAVSRLVNPYVQPVLYIRKPGEDYDQMLTFPDDDPFFSEVLLVFC